MVELARAKGFCDLNIPSDAYDLNGTVLKALAFGYQTIAINKYVVDTMAITSDKQDGADEGSKIKKRKKGKQKMDNENKDPIPKPVTVSISEQDLKQLNLKRKPLILSRITISHSDPSSPFLSKYASAIKEYDLVAIAPENDSALKQIIWNKVVNVDIISLAPESFSNQFSRSLIKSAGERDIYYELCYSPCFTNLHHRKQTITLSHYLHRHCHTANVIISSQARTEKQLRGPYDIMNLGRFLGLSELAAKWSISNTTHNAIYCAMARRRGLSKCAVNICVTKQGENGAKYDGLHDASSYLNSGDDGPPSKNNEGDDGPPPKKIKTMDTNVIKVLQQGILVSEEKKKKKGKNLKKANKKMKQMMKKQKFDES